MIALEFAIGQKARHVRTEDLDGYLRQQKFDLKNSRFWRAPFASFKSGATIFAA